MKTGRIDLTGQNADSENRGATFTRRGFFGLFAGVSAIPEVKSVERLVVRPEDILVVSVRGRADAETLDRIKKLAESKLPAGMKVMVHDDSIGISVLRKE